MKKALNKSEVVSLEAYILMAIHHHNLYLEARKSLAQLLGENPFKDSELTEYVDETILTGLTSLDVQSLLLVNDIEVES